MVIELEANLPEGEFFDRIIGEPVTGTEEQEALLVESTNQAESGEFVDAITTTDDERPNFSPINSQNLWLLAFKSKAKSQSRQALNLELWLVRIYIDDSNSFSTNVQLSFSFFMNKYVIVFFLFIFFAKSVDYRMFHLP